MNDMYLFRGKHIRPDAHGEWIEGGLFYPEKGCAWIVIKAPGEYEQGIIRHLRVDPATVGRCTGLRDKNGTLIFEGDVLESEPDRYRLHAPPLLNVYWKDGFGFLMAHVKGFSVERTLDDFGSFHTVDHVKYMLRISNIHDNPELLEVQHA